jgi:hypothetical protein
MSDGTERVDWAALANPYHCGEYQNRVSDALTQWKPSHGHRGSCNAPDGKDCPCCDAWWKLQDHQHHLVAKASDGLGQNAEVVVMLATHIEKWGNLTGDHRVRPDGTLVETTHGVDCECGDSCLEYTCLSCHNMWSSSRNPSSWECDCGGNIVVC